MAGFVPRKFPQVNFSRVKGLGRVFRKFDSQERRLAQTQRRFWARSEKVEKTYALGSAKELTKFNIKMRAVLLARMELQFKKLNYLLTHARALKLTAEQIRELEQSRLKLETEFNKEHDAMTSEKSDLAKEL